MKNLPRTNRTEEEGLDLQEKVEEQEGQEKRLAGEEKIGERVQMNLEQTVQKKMKTMKMTVSASHSTRKKEREKENREVQSETYALYKSRLCLHVGICFVWLLCL